MYESSKITSKGQITIPISLRKKLNLKDGDKVFFYEEDDHILILNEFEFAFKLMQEEFKGVAEEFNLKTDDDVVKLIKEFRKEQDEDSN